MTGAELVLEQQRRALDALKIPDDEKGRRIQLQKQIMNAVITGQGWEGVPAAVRKQSDTPWFRSFLLWDPVPVIKKVEQPLLIMHGALDRQVPVRSAELLNDFAAQRKKGPATLILVPGINHLLVPATTGDVSEYASLTDPRISPQVGTQIADWLKGLPGR